MKARKIVCRSEIRENREGQSSRADVEMRLNRISPRVCQIVVVVVEQVDLKLDFLTICVFSTEPPVLFQLQPGPRDVYEQLRCNEGVLWKPAFAK
jgi:hypothetical protein